MWYRQPVTIVRGEPSAPDWQPQRAFAAASCVRRCAQIRVIVVAFVADLLDTVEHVADGVDLRQQAAGDFGIERQFSFAQLAEQVLADMRQRFELAEAKKAAGSLDRVDRAEDAGERRL